MSAVSAAVICAVGSFGNSLSVVISSLTLHWDGTSWSLVPSPNAVNDTNYLYGVAAVSANDAWAVGQYHVSISNTWSTLTMHWDVAQWSIVPSPNGGQTNNVLRGVR